MLKLVTILTAVLLCLEQKSAAQITAELYRFNSTSKELSLNRPNHFRITGLRPGDQVTLGTVFAERVDSGLIKAWELFPELADTNIYTFRSSRSFCDTLFIRRRGQVIFSKGYFVERNKDIDLRLGVVTMRRSMTATKEEILAYPRLFVSPGDLRLYWFVVRSFAMSIQTKDAWIGPLVGKEERLSTDQIELIKQLRPGDRVWFEDIRVMGSDGGLRAMNSLAIMIK